MSDQALLVLGEIRGDVRSTKAAVDLVMNEVKRHGTTLEEHGVRIGTIEQQIGTHPPRQRMTTLETIEQPAVSQSISAINNRTEKGFRHNFWLTLLAIVTPIAIAAIQNCGHH